MKHVVLSDEFIEKMADTYQDKQRTITFQEFIELEINRLKEAIAG